MSKKVAFMSMFMASRKQTLEREYQTYTVRPLSISTTTKPKFSYQVLGEHHKDRAEERAARSDAKVRSIFSDNFFAVILFLLLFTSSSI